MKEIQKLIESSMEKHNRDLSNGLFDFIDYLIEFYDISALLESYDFYQNFIKEKYEKDDDLFMANLRWLSLVESSLSQGRYIDVFGHLYESHYQSRMKASSLGQFFTPDSICDLMAKISCSESRVLNDPTCGSGRTLLSGYMEFYNKGVSRQAKIVGEDIDYISCKMCALNLMIHGANAKVICHDTLNDPNQYNFIIHVNEVRFPIPTPYYSLRYEYPK